MHSFVRNLITEWRRLRLPFAGDVFIAAVSGGADSLAVLLAIDELRKQEKLDLRVVAAHFNHKLRGPESDADEHFVRAFAMEREIELAIGHGAISKEGNLEQNARAARYAFLVETARNVKAGFVLTGHTLNDQAETFLLNLIRGSGPDGLAGMRAVREMGRRGVEESGRAVDSSPLPFSPTPLLVRPLLRWARREDTENFCRSLGVEFRYDSMNEDMSFKRVRVRKMLLPMLKEFNPDIVATLARTAELMGEGPETSKNTSQPADNGQLPDELSIKELANLENAELRQAIRSWLASRRGSLRSISLKHVDAVAGLVKSRKSGRIAELPGFSRVRKSKGRLIYENIKVDN